MCFTKTRVAQGSGQVKGFTCVAQTGPRVQERLQKPKSLAPVFVSRLGDLPVQMPYTENMSVNNCLWHHRLHVHAACTVRQHTCESLFVSLQTSGILIYGNVCQVYDNGLSLTGLS